MCAWAAYFEHRLQVGQKPIIHLEAFVARFMTIYKQARPCYAAERIAAAAPCGCAGNKLRALPASVPHHRVRGKGACCIGDERACCRARGGRLLGVGVDDVIMENDHAASS